MRNPAIVRAVSREHALFQRWLDEFARPDTRSFVSFKEFRRQADAGEIAGLGPAEYGVLPTQANEEEPLF